MTLRLKYMMEISVVRVCESSTCQRRRCRDGTAAGWATVSLAIKFLGSTMGTQQHIVPHTGLCAHMLTFVAICTHKDTHRGHTCRHVHIRAHTHTHIGRENYKLTKYLLQHLFPISYPSCPADVKLHTVTLTYAHIHNNNCSLYTNMFYKNNLTHTFISNERVALKCIVVFDRRASSSTKEATLLTLYQSNCLCTIQLRFSFQCTISICILNKS